MKAPLNWARRCKRRNINMGPLIGIVDILQEALFPLIRRLIQYLIFFYRDREVGKQCREHKISFRGNMGLVYQQSRWRYIHWTGQGRCIACSDQQMLLLQRATPRDWNRSITCRYWDWRLVNNISRGTQGSWKQLDNELQQCSNRSISSTQKLR